MLFAAGAVQARGPRRGPAMRGPAILVPRVVAVLVIVVIVAAVVMVPPLAPGLVIVAVAVPVPARRDPYAVPVRRVVPAAANPGVMARGAIPVAADPDIIRTWGDSDDHFLTRRGRRTLQLEVDG